MKKITLLSLSVASATVLLFSCSGDSNKKKRDRLAKNPKHAYSVDTSFLADTSYIYHNITNTNDMKWTGRPSNQTDTFDNNIYTDSTYKKRFLMLTKAQRLQLISRFISKELDVNEKYARDLMSAYFLSKQAKIGNLQPIIFNIDGDDYWSETMILFDENYKPVNGINLSGGQQPGPTEIGDSLTMYDKDSYSYINKNRITTIRISETDYTDSTRTDVIIDSSVFESIIHPNGYIQTKQTVKTRYIKKGAHK